MKRLTLLAMVAALITSACTKDIKLDLSNGAGHLVIEGNITNQPGPYFVVLQNTVSFYDSNNVVPVSGAHVVLSDNAGHRDSMYETFYPGLYEADSITGTVGRVYHLSVNTGGKQYDAYSTLNAPVPVDSVGAQVFTLLGKQLWQVFATFQDPVTASTNYYKATVYQNGSQQNPVAVANDQHTNGLMNQIYVTPNLFYNLYDTVQVELDVIDQPIYTYYYTLNNSTLSQLTAAPANPVSNFSNNALGYFSAYSPSFSYRIVLTANGFQRL